MLAASILLFIWGISKLNGNETDSCSANFDNKIDSIYNDLTYCCACSTDSIVPTPPPIPPLPEPPIPADTVPEKPKPPVKDTKPKKPKANCRVHFSGGLMGGKFDDVGISKIYVEDRLSEYVGSGHYPSNESAFPKAVRTTFDGIAIDKGTRLIIYSKPNFKGTILLDVTGPAIINNVKWKDDDSYKYCNTETYPSDLQANYPQSVRKWSSSNMETWSTGSCKIECAE